MYHFMRFCSLILMCCLVLAATHAPARADERNAIGEMKIISAEYEDTLVYLARDYKLGYVELIAANPSVDPWLPGAGTQIKLPMKHLLPDAPREGVIVNLAEMRLYAFVDDADAVPITYPIGIGREGLETPTGETYIGRKVKGPVWFPTPRMREEAPDLPEAVGPGKDNPLGSHALYLGWPSYLIHGTNRPFGIGRRVSSGCIRMYPEDIAALYALASVDMPVSVIEQFVKAAWVGDDFYVEIAPTEVQSVQFERAEALDDVPLTDEERTYIEGKAGEEEAERLNWEEIERAAALRRGAPVFIMSRKSPGV